MTELDPYRRWLDSLAVGDPVLLHPDAWGAAPRQATVTEATATHLYVGVLAFRRLTGRCVSARIQLQNPIPFKRRNRS